MSAESAEKSPSPDPIACPKITILYLAESAALKVRDAIHQMDLNTTGELVILLATRDFSKDERRLFGTGNDRHDHGSYRTRVIVSRLNGEPILQSEMRAIQNVARSQAARCLITLVISEEKNT